MPPKAVKTRTGGLVDVQVFGDSSDVQRVLKRLDTGFSVLGMAGFLHTTVGPYLQQRAKRRFDTEGDDVSGKWTPLTHQTRAIRAKGPWNVGPAHPINVRTHEMEQYVTGSMGDAVPVGFMAVLTFPDPGTLKGRELRQKVEHAQIGAKPGRRSHNGTPPRPVLGLNSTDLVFVIGALNFYAKQLMKGGGVKVTAT